MFGRINRFSFKNTLPKNILNSQSFNLRFENNGENLKVGVVVSKRVDIRSVIRNRIKRQVLEITARKIKLATPISIVFYIKKNAVENLNLEHEVDEVINKILNA